MRCFIAIELPPDVRSTLERLIRSLRRPGRDVRWSSAEQLHITLKFLGSVSDADIPRICEITAAAARAVAPFELRLAALGGFPSVRSPRVAWIGVDDPAGGCAAWLAAADSEFESIGVPCETRPFHPHVTLGRSKSPAGNRLLGSSIASLAPPPAIRMNIDAVTVFESRPGKDGSEYTPIARAPFGEA